MPLDRLAGRLGRVPPAGANAGEQTGFASPCFHRGLPGPDLRFPGGVLAAQFHPSMGPVVRA